SWGSIFPCFPIPTGRSLGRITRSKTTGRASIAPSTWWPTTGPSPSRSAAHRPWTRSSPWRATGRAEAVPVDFGGKVALITGVGRVGQIGQVLERGGGAIVNFASIAVLKPQRLMASYIAAKAAVAGLTRALAREFADRGVPVNAVAPGMMKTADNLAQMKDAKVRWVELDQLVNAVLFLASDAAGAITGEILPVTGEV